MRTIRIYQEGHYLPGDTIDLSPAAAQHVGLVLRMQPGSNITLFRNDNNECLATLISVQKRRVSVLIDTISEINRESPRAIHLAQGISKGERMDFVMQKAVELGVASITPLLTAHCVVRLDKERMAKKLQHWQAITISACEQSGRNLIPVIHPICSFEHYIEHCDARLKWILYPDSTQSCRDYAIQNGDIALLIGPEGGFSPHEINEARHHQFQSLRLGPRILRTETATLAALSILQSIYGDL